MSKNPTYPRITLEPIPEGSLLGEYAACRWYAVARWKYGPDTMDTTGVFVPGVEREDALTNLALELAKRVQTYKEGEDK